MDLQDQLDTLAGRIAGFTEPPALSDEEWRAFADDTVVALMAGGESSRFAAVLQGEQAQKSGHELPNGDTMIEMAIRQYRDAGITRFTALVYHHADTIRDRIGDGSTLGVDITYSKDPDPPAGKGGAIRHAIDTGAIPSDAHLVVANPDDVVLDFPGFVRYIGAAHLEGERRGKLATAVLAPGQAYASTGMMVVDGEVVDTQMYPLIPVPAHVGITVFSPALLPRFAELFSLRERSDFENVLFPILAREGRLWSAGLTRGTWIAVNDLKSYQQLVRSLPSAAPTGVPG